MHGSHRSTTRRSGLVPAIVLLALIAAVVTVLAIRVVASGNRHSDASAAHQSSGQHTSAPPSTATGSMGVAGLTAGSSSATPAQPAASTTAATRPPLTYVVQPGDNLWSIAAWFKMQGYADLYARNKAVLGDNPRLIHPGQRITISAQGMTTGN